MQSRNSNNIQGCDLSHYEAAVAVNAAPGSIVYLKATEGQRTTDPSFDTLFIKVKAAGKKVGAYHFLHVGGNYTMPAQVENAAFAVSGKSFDCRFGIDLEDGGYHGGTPEQVTSQVLNFADNFTAKTKIPCCVYSNTAFIKEHFTSDLKRLPLWVAHYGVTTPGDNGVWESWAGFQYTDKPYDLDEFTTGILIDGSTQPTPTPTGDVYAVSSLPCSWNATAGTDFDVRNADGAVVAGRQIYKGDRLIIRSVNFDAQLAEVLYPTRSDWMHCWIRNLQPKIHDRWHFKWRNGSTKEIVYGAPTGLGQIGSIYPYEYATPLFSVGSRYALLYNTSKGDETKFGYVDYHSRFKF